MSIEFRCSQCDQLLRVPDDSAGKNARCPKCQALMIVPSAVAIVQSPTDTLPPAGSSAPEERAAQSEPMSSPPPKEAAPSSSPFALDNPFGDAGPRTKSTEPINPYASPAGAIDAYHANYTFPDGRPGLPWETERQTVGCWFRTAGIVLGSPTQAFSDMRQHGGLGTPMLYSIYGIGLPVVGLMLLAAAIVLIAVLASGEKIGPEEIAAGALVGLFAVVAIGLYVLIVATLGTLINAAVYHLMLMIVGGARSGFETTFRVVAYTQGALFWLMFIPYIGMIGGIWWLVVFIIGLARAHEISGGKAALAIFLPMILCLGLFFMFFLIAAGIEAVNR
jgi:phage FluMu protein Com